MKKPVIAVIPLDNRPPNYDFLLDYQLENLFTLLLPDRTTLGTLKKGASWFDLKAWLEKILDYCDYLVVSFDAILYGGLVQSRRGTIADGVEADIHAFFRSTKKRWPALTVYGYSIIMRSSISTLDAKTAAVYKNILLYFEALNQHQPSGEITRLYEAVGSENWDAYYTARRQKQAHDVALLDLVGTQALDFLLYLQEDAVPGGPQKKDQKAISAKIAQLGVAAYSALYNGADEAALLLLAKAVSGFYQCDPQVNTVFASPSLAEQCAPYEDFPVITNYKNMLAVLGMAENPTGKKLFIYLEPGSTAAEKAVQRQNTIKASDSQLAHQVKDHAIYKAFVAQIQAAHHCYLADIAYPNGGIPELMQATQPHLASYSAWNTATNTLGTILAAICLDSTSEKVSGATAGNPRFFSQRLLDDCYYQSWIRPRLEAALKASFPGVNLYSLSAAETAFAETFILSEYQRLVPDGLVVKASLPWQRTFEVRLELSAGRLPQ